MPQWQPIHLLEYEITKIWLWITELRNKTKTNTWFHCYAFCLLHIYHSICICISGDYSSCKVSTRNVLQTLIHTYIQVITCTNISSWQNTEIWKMLKMSDKYQKIYIYQTIIIIKIKYEDSFTQNIKKQLFKRTSKRYFCLLFKSQYIFINKVHYCYISIWGIINATHLNNHGQ